MYGSEFRSNDVIC